MGAKRSAGYQPLIIWSGHGVGDLDKYETLVKKEQERIGRKDIAVAMEMTPEELDFVVDKARMKNYFVKRGGKNKFNQIYKSLTFQTKWYIEKARRLLNLELRIIPLDVSTAHNVKIRPLAVRLHQIVLENNIDLTPEDFTGNKLSPRVSKKLSPKIIDEIESIGHKIVALRMGEGERAMFKQILKEKPHVIELGGGHIEGITRMGDFRRVIKISPEGPDRKNLLLDRAARLMYQRERLDAEGGPLSHVAKVERRLKQRKRPK